MTRELRFGDQTKAPAFRLRQVEWQEWWLWASAIVITLVLTFGIFSLTFPGPHLPSDTIYSINLKEWVRGLAALVLLFNLYIVYQQRQLQRIRRQLAEREQLFQVITENAADMIAVIDRSGQRVYNSPAYEKILGYSQEELAATSAMDQIHPEDRELVREASVKARAWGATGIPHPSQRRFLAFSRVHRQRDSRSKRRHGRPGNREPRYHAKKTCRGETGAPIISR
ncbi:MAG: hypothetical protein DMG79_20540 [Acidobacteria bacterium]|nr:MAG: hypothetical protein DMG79_20540 [Acidobacteriota bacterium]